MIAPVIGALLLDAGWHWIFIAIGFYTLLVLGLYASGVPESNESRVSRVEIRPIFAAYRHVATHRLSTGLHPLRYGLANGIAYSILFTYLTNSSYIFQTYFGVSANLFTVFFALNVGFMALVQVSSSRYLRGKSLQAMAKFMRFGFVSQLVALAATLLLTLSADTPFWLFMVFLMVSLGLLGIIVPSAIGVYMAPFRQSSGTASAISTTLAFTLGAALGSLSGLLNQGGLLACFGIMLGASVVANAILFSIGSETERVALNALQNGDEPTI